MFWKSNDKSDDFVAVAKRFDSASVGSDYSSCYGKTNPVSACFSASRVIRSVEPVEQSVQLALRGEDVAQLQFWRGDKNPESAFRYLQNKGDLIRELEATNELLARALMKEGENIFEA